MDINRGILKALFYDYPVDKLVALLDGNAMQYDEFLDIMPQLLQWSKQEYTYTEAQLLRIQTGGAWQRETRYDYLSTVYHAMDILKELTSCLLSFDGNDPVVKFDQLFRWRETTLYVGEDLLTTAFVAQQDVVNAQRKREWLLWKDIIKHNNRILNAELDKGLFDLHAHYYATVDVFSLNWICLMNRVNLRQQFSKRLKRSQELELLPPQTLLPSTIEQQCVAAAYLRFVFYQMLFNEQSYGNGDRDNELLETNYANKVLHILTDAYYANDFVSSLQASISAALVSSIPTVEGNCVDYCLLPKDEQMLLNEKNENIANLLYQGERDLLYTFFYGYYRQDPKCVHAAPYFYLYLLIKNKIRREFVQINPIKGFENFETYQDRKGILIPDNSPIAAHIPYYAFYSSVNSMENDSIEVRINPGNLNQLPLKHNKRMFKTHERLVNYRREKPCPLEVVVHFIKNGKYEYPTPTSFDKVGKMKDGTRDRRFRKDIQKQLNMVLLYNNHNKKIGKTKNNIVGIDAASREIFCRPETFGHVFRYAYTQGIQERTFHAGEDFLDLPDGLRAIDEAILFLQLDDKCRIGHAMALGIDAKAYYERRHYTTIITKQNLLDNCVWIYMRSKELNVALSPTIEVAILEKASQLYHEIGYCCDCEPDGRDNMGRDWNVQHYWHSMLLRGNDPEYLDRNTEDMITPWEKTANVENERIYAAQKDPKAQDLFRRYFRTAAIKRNGLQLVQYKWDKEIVTVMTEMQDKMRYFVSKKRIGIECCPTSNLKIGYIEKYENHPLLTKFYPIDATANYPLIKSSINTDDRGVFYTSPYREYSLIALALYKMKDENNEHKYNEREIVRYIAEIRKNAELMAFEHLKQ